MEGRVLAGMRADGQPIPAWVWLNALAHRPVDEVGNLVGAACDQPDDIWAAAVVDMALDIGRIGQVEATRIQADLLVPAELEALAGPYPPDGPGRLVRAVRGRLVASRCRTGLHNPHPDQPER